MANKKITVTDLDFDNIKANLKEFLKGQTEFQDYDFEGSGMAILLDILAYNTHYNALYNNLSVNEMFLDSASKRNSVVSLAKMLGYVPRSSTCAKSNIRVTVNSGIIGPSALTLPSGSTFSTSVDGITYTFSTTQSYTITGAGTQYTFDNVSIVEGTPLTYKYEVTTGARFIIPNNNVDLTTLRVRVQESSTSSLYETFVSSASITTADRDTRVYFVKEIDDGLYELNFGDDVIGKKLDSGNVVHIDYFVSSLDAPNGARLFNYTGQTLLSNATVNITTIDVASGGSSAEDIESIRFNAPRAYAAQNRAVTPEDYKTIIYNAMSEADAVSVWGGEDNNPPVYGKIFVCVKPKDASKLTQQQKANLTSSILTSKNVVSVIPEIVDPEYINIALDVTVYYNERETTRTAAEIETIVTDTIFAYDNTDLQNFDGVFRYSKLSRLIDSCEQGIMNNITTVTLRRKLQPRYNVSAQYLINLINPIYSSGIPEGAVQTSALYISGSDELHYIDDDGLGNLRLYKFGSNASKIIVDENIGTVDYNKGIIDIRNLNITGIIDDFEIAIKPNSNDVVSALTQIAQVARDHLTVTAIADKSANGDLRGGYNYVFSQSRT